MHFFICLLQGQARRVPSRAKNSSRCLLGRTLSRLRPTYCAVLGVLPESHRKAARASYLAQCLLSVLPVAWHVHRYIWKFLRNFRCVCKVRLNGIPQPLPELQLNLIPVIQASEALFGLFLMYIFPHNNKVRATHHDWLACPSRRDSLGMTATSP